MKSQEQIEVKIKDLEKKLAKQTVGTMAWYSISAKIIALDWVLKESTYMGKQ